MTDASEAVPIPPDGLLEMLEKEIKQIGMQVVEGVTCELKRFMVEQTRTSQTRAAHSQTGCSNTGMRAIAATPDTPSEPPSEPPGMLASAAMPPPPSEPPSELPGIIVTNPPVARQNADAPGCHDLPCAVDPPSDHGSLAERMGKTHAGGGRSHLCDTPKGTALEDLTEEKSSFDENSSQGRPWAHKRASGTESSGVGTSIQSILGAKRAGGRSTLHRSSTMSDNSKDSWRQNSPDGSASDTSRDEQAVNRKSQDGLSRKPSQKRSSFARTTSGTGEDVMTTLATERAKTMEVKRRIKHQIPRSLTMMTTMHGRKVNVRECCWYIMETYTDHVMGVILVVNAIWMGIIVDVKVRIGSGDHAVSVAEMAYVVEWVFCCIFFVELAIRLCLHPRRFFSFAAGWAWNLFDVMVLALQVADQSILLIVDGNEHNKLLDGLSLLRMLRLGRLIRMVRMVRISPQLKSMVYLIVASMPSFCWTAILILLLLYTAAIYFTEVAHDMVQNLQNVEEQAAIETYWNSITRSMLTLYMAISGGGDWKDFVEVFLSQDPMGLHTLIFVTYVAFSTLVMLNLVTGVFVEGAQRLIRKEQDEEIGRMAEKMFARSDSDKITWENFVSLEEAPAMSAYCAAVGITQVEAVGLFELLDTEGLGELQISEFVKGSLRLRSAARTIDVAQLGDYLQQSLTMLDKRSLATHKITMKLWSSMRSLNELADARAK